jgi:hypothetical protein
LEEARVYLSMHAQVFPKHAWKGLTVVGGENGTDID